MNKYIVIFISLAFIFSCKKKKDETPIPEPQPAPVTPVVNKIMKAKINGVNWSMGNNAYSTSQSGGMFFTFSGKTDYTTINNSITLDLSTTPGMFTFSNSPCGATYIDSAGVYRSALGTGTIHITEIDTFQYGVKKLKATFGFVTVPLGGKTYTISDGVVDWTGN